MTFASDKKTNFFVANCLHCDGIVRVPISIRPGSNVVCPHCSAKLDLNDLIDQIPEVEVTDSGNNSGGSGADEFEIETGSVTAQENGKFVVPPQLSSGIKKRRRRRRRSSESSSSTSSSSSSSSAPMTEAEENRQALKAEKVERERAKFQQKRETGAINVEPRRRSGRSRKSEPKRNPVAEALKIIVGGLLAAPVAYLLLIWVFNRDPLGLVPTINSMAPALVPDHLVMDDDTGKDTPPVVVSDEEGEDEDDRDDFFKNLPVPETDPDTIDPAAIVN